VAEGTKMIDYDGRPERSILVAVLAQGADEDRELAEMLELLRTAQVDVVGKCVQHRSAIHPRTYIGSGKLEELKQRARELEAEVVVTEDELTPSQQRTLEDELAMRVVDRTRVILDIFALHAHSAAGKLQVELAQLEYNLQRMRGMWKHLERLGGGVGTRGPGESQLETDRRLARTRISLLRRRLRELRKQRATMRRQRERNEVPSVALAGYTNVGKSTLLNALTGAGVSSADRLFETLDPTTRSYDYLGRTYLLTDTVGFVRKLPHQLVAAFASTLEETLLADLILHVADAGADEEERDRQIASVETVLDEIGASELPRLLVLNKADRCSAEERRRLRNRRPDAVLASALNGEGLLDIERAIGEHFAGRFEHVALLVPFDQGGVLAELYALGSPIEREDTAEGVLIRAHLPHALAERYASFRLVPTGA
jgi:GTP-binding protein HflX